MDSRTICKVIMDATLIVHNENRYYNDEIYATYQLFMNVFIGNHIKGYLR